MHHVAPHQEPTRFEPSLAVTANLLSDLIVLHQRQMALFDEFVQHMHVVQAAQGADSHRTHPALQVPPFYVSFLGSFVLYRGQSRIVLGNNKAVLELCRYFFAHAGRMIARDTLLDLLWPESSVQQGTHRLHVAISTLRQLLGGTEQGKQIILHEDDHYVLPKHLVVSDCDLFESYYQHAKRRLRQNDFANTANAFSEAMTLYQGDYLADHCYAEWTHSTRAYFAECRFTTLTFLCEYAAMQQDFMGIIDYAGQLLALDSLRERAHRLLIRAYYALGQRASAVAQYRRCEELLQRELGVMPSQQTQQLYQAICQDAVLPKEIPFFHNLDE